MIKRLPLLLLLLSMQVHASSETIYTKETYSGSYPQVWDRIYQSGCSLDHKESLYDLLQRITTWKGSQGHCEHNEQNLIITQTNSNLYFTVTHGEGDIFCIEKYIPQNEEKHNESIHLLSSKRDVSFFKNVTTQYVNDRTGSKSYEN